MEIILEEKIYSECLEKEERESFEELQKFSFYFKSKLWYIISLLIFLLRRDSSVARS